MDVIDKEIEHLEQDLENIIQLMKNESSDEGKFCGKAFIIFNSQQKAEQIINEFKMSLFKRFWYYIFFKLFRCKRCFSSEHSFEDKRIQMKRPAEPTDIYWVNIPIKNKERSRNIVFTYCVMVIILAISFGVNFALGTLNNTLEDEASDNEGRTSFTATLILLVLSFAKGILVSVINFIIGRVARYITLFEKQQTYTDYNLSVAIKLTLGLFVNSGIIPFFVNFSKDDWFTRTGLVIDVFFITLSVSFISPIFYAYSIPYLKNRYII